MQTKEINLYSLQYNEAKTYLVAAAFVVGNILLPQLCHLIPKGGLILLPIYFFTLIGAYKYGWRVGLLTAIASPLCNHLLFGMPPLGVLPLILIKSTLLALAAGFAARYVKLNLILTLALVVAAYQVVGTLFEWAIIGNVFTALQDFRVGLPGMLIQVFGGFLFLKYIKTV